MLILIDIDIFMNAKFYRYDTFNFILIKKQLKINKKVIGCTTTSYQESNQPKGHQ